MTTTIECPRCHGDGRLYHQGYRENGENVVGCSNCAATGRVPNPQPASPEQLAMARLLDALAKVTPIRVQNGPDYAEVYFADGAKHSTQAMTMNPQDWLDIQTAFDHLCNGDPS